MCFKRFLLIILTVFIFSSLSAAEKIDDIISDAAASVIENCSSDSVVAVGVFDTPSAEMSDYFYENMMSLIRTSDKSFKIIEREQLALVNETDTVFAAANRLGADSILFVTVNEYNDVQIKMLRLATGEIIFLKFCNMDDTVDVDMLLNGNKKASLAVFFDLNNGFSGRFSDALGVSLDYSFGDKFLSGAKLSLDNTKDNTEDGPFIIDVIGIFRYFVISFEGVPYSGVFAEAQIGADEYIYGAGNVWVFNAGLNAGLHIEYKSFFAEASISTGYPYVFRCGFTGGYRLHF